MNARPPLLLLIVLAASVWLPACGDDDDPTSPQPSQIVVVVEVTDPAGDPVEGLDLSLTMDTDFFQDKIALPAAGEPGRPAVTIPFRVDRLSQVRLSVEDIAGQEVRLLGDQSVPAGPHHWVWNGMDDQNEGLPSGVYTVRLVVRDPDTDAILLEEAKVILMTILDAGRYSVGTTDRNGRIHLTDRKLFPYLFEIEDILAVDESGDPRGWIEITPTMRFQLFDLANGGSHRFYRDVTGSATYTVTWNPPLKGAAAAPEAMAAVPSGADPASQGNELGQPYPVPFN
jgi:hypothetical protein